MVFMNFDYNNLSVLPKEVGKLTNLTRLSFNRNRYDTRLLESLRAS
jgi:Leucine-rich repeat (LRR) protein